MYSKYEVYTSIQSIYCYNGTNILKNNLNILDAEVLKKVEEEITQTKQMEIIKNPIRGNFTKTHLLNIHKFIFEDIYPFAGKLRKEQISKANTTFYPPYLIDQNLNEVFHKIKSNDMLRERDAEKVFENLAYVMAELNIIHPFREGNGRTIREFIRLMANKCGYDLNWGNTNNKEILESSIDSVDDNMVLIPVLKKCCKII